MRPQGQTKLGFFPLPMAEAKRLKNWLSFPERFSALSPDGMKAFGVLDLATEMEGCRFSIGLRNSHDKSMRLAMTSGYRVFVCSNMAFAGDFTPVLAKHSKSFSLIDCISVGVDRMQRNFEPMRKQVEMWQRSELTDVTVI